MAQYHTEAKAQCWRAVAVFDDRHDCLIYVGRSSLQVRNNFAEVFFDLLDDEERSHVRSISLQKWNGAPDSGRWVQQQPLSVPSKPKLTAAKAA